MSESSNFSSITTALKKLKHYKEDEGDKATRAKLLWDLILTRNKVRHKGSLKPRPLHKSLEVYTVPLKVGKPFVTFSECCSAVIVSTATMYFQYERNVCC